LVVQRIVEGVWPAILLAWVAGFVDALGYLDLAHVFTAHMSGNSASFAAHLGRGDWQEAMVRGLAIPPFIIGVALGVLAEKLAVRRRDRARLAPAFGLELICLTAFICIDRLRSPGVVEPGKPVFFCLASLLALAMGLQSATLRRAGGTKVRTTYISGMLTNMTENGVYYVLRKWRRNCRQSQEESTSEQPFGRLAAKFGLIFLSFVAGAACGGFGQTVWGSPSLLAPICGLGVLIAQDSICRASRAEDDSCPGT
jgi:uncharacterized membrane protein YoaK (UPF0700 family)